MSIAHELYCDMSSQPLKNQSAQSQIKLNADNLVNIDGLKCLVDEFPSRLEFMSNRDAALNQLLFRVQGSGLSINNLCFQHVQKRIIHSPRSPSPLTPTSIYEWVHASIYGSTSGFSTSRSSSSTSSAPSSVTCSSFAISSTRLARRTDRV